MAVLGTAGDLTTIRADRHRRDDRGMARQGGNGAAVGHFPDMQVVFVGGRDEAATVRADRQERVACSQALGNRHRGELPAINGVVQNHIVPAIGSTHDDSRDSRAV